MTRFFHRLGFLGGAAVVVLCAEVAGARMAGELLRDLPVPLRSRGNQIGVVEVPAGTAVWIVREAGGRKLVETPAGTVWVPAGAVRASKETPHFRSGSGTAPTQRVLEGPARITIRVPPGRRTDATPGRVPVFPTGREDPAPGNPEAERRVLELVNAERAANRLPLLTWDADLARAARFHAAHMFENRYFDHRTLVGRKSLAAEDRVFLFSGKFRSENIGRGYRTPERAVEALMNSPGHRANILDPEARYLGVGVWGDMWVQDFGS